MRISKVFAFSTLLLGMALCFTNCGETITGCTNPNAQNYNPDATEDDGNCQIAGCTDEDADNYDAAANADDGSCTFFNLYEGSYTALFECEGTLAALLSDAEFTITMSPQTMNLVDLQVTATGAELVVPMKGSITKEVLTIDTNLPMVPLEIPGAPPGLQWEVTVTGDLVRDATGVLSGTVMFNLKELTLQGLVPDINDTCVVTATK